MAVTVPPCRKVRLETISRTSHLVDQPLRTNSRASQSSSSGCVGASPRWPKSFGVATMPRPNSQCHTRFTYTRAVSGLSGRARNSASSNRPLPLLLATPFFSEKIFRKSRGTGSPCWCTSPRTSSRYATGAKARSSRLFTTAAFPMRASVLRYVATSVANRGEASVCRGNRPFSINHCTTAVSPALARLSAQAKTESASHFAIHSMASSREAGGLVSYSETNASSSSLGVAPVWCVAMPVMLSQLRLPYPISLCGSPAARPVRGGKFGFRSLVANSTRTSQPLFPLYVPSLCQLGAACLRNRTFSA